mmetsp:Transcript_135873/g.253882  ORF Transcript_135873/g.253882 Transcript_135873/m.253882 type:complete len:427 (-) Transcript_135873:61-1341(-)
MLIRELLLLCFLISAPEHRAQVAGGSYDVQDVATSSHYASSKAQLRASSPSQALVTLLLAFIPAGVLRPARTSFKPEFARLNPRMSTEVLCTRAALSDKLVSSEAAKEVLEGLLTEQSFAEESLISDMQAIRADPAPAQLYQSRHWLTSTEYPPYYHKWNAVHDLGGIMVGVGAEQNYILAGWARPEILVLMDFDSYIPWLHKAYGVAFGLAATPDEFLTLWCNDEGRERLETGIVHKYGRAGEVQNILQVLGEALRPGMNAPGGIGLALAQLRESHSQCNTACFLNNQEQYDFVANLWRRGRVLAVQGDLLGKRTMVDIAAFARKVALPVRVLYTSNAQDGFGLDERWRDNVAALPFDSCSLVLRAGKRPLVDGTCKSSWLWPRDVWFSQRGLDLVAWLNRWKASNVSLSVFVSSDLEGKKLQPR